MVHGQADDFVGYLSGDGQVLRRCAGQAAIGAEVADERVEIAAAKDALLTHLEIELVAGHAVLMGIDEDGEVAIVKPHPQPLSRREGGCRGGSRRIQACRGIGGCL